VLPEERFFNSYFVPMLLPAYHIDEARKPCTVDGMNQAHASHARAKRHRQGAASSARRTGRLENKEIAPRLRREHAGSARSWPAARRTSCGTCPRDRPCRRLSACRCKKDG